MRKVIIFVLLVGFLLGLAMLFYGGATPVPLLDQFLGLTGLAAFVWLLVWLRPRPEPPKPDRLIVVDGSNVMHWDEAGPSLKVLGRVIDDLRGRGFVPQVYFDANVGYKIAGRHMKEAEIAHALRLTAQQITLSPSGTPADPLLIDFALRRGLRVVSNDRYRDWRADFPRLGDKGVLVGGRYVSGRVELRGLG